jgi:hypothetical protein
MIQRARPTSNVITEMVLFALVPVDSSLILPSPLVTGHLMFPVVIVRLPLLRQLLLHLKPHPRRQQSLKHQRQLLPNLNLHLLRLSHQYLQPHHPHPIRHLGTLSSPHTLMSTSKAQRCTMCIRNQVKKISFLPLPLVALKDASPNGVVKSI